MSGIAFAIGLAYVPGAQAMEFTTADGVQVNWTTNLSIGQAWRAANRDPRLLNANNAILLGITGATGGNTDNSNLNHPKGESFTTLLNLSSELRLRKDSFGAALGIRGWKDYTLRDQSVSHGSFVNRYQANTPLNDIGFEDYARFSNIVLMNAYAYNNFPVGEGNLKITAGRHVLNWGNDLFIQGMNQINAINFNAARAPGLDPSDIRLPQSMLSARFDIDKGKSLEAFYQFQYQNNVFPGCGTYFQTVDASIGPNTQNACASAFVQAAPGTGDAGGVKLGDILHLVGEVATGGRWWQRPPVFVIQLDCFLNDLAQLFEYRLFVRTVTAAVYQTRRASNIALILFRPFNDLGVSRTFLHDFDSWMARLTART